MDTHKKKVLAVPPSTNDSKANWTDPKATESFLKACFDQVTKGERVGTCFTKKGWKGIVSQFNALTGRKYDKIKLKNRYDNLRKEWRVWDNLFGKVTGLGWNSEKNTVDAPDEWWENKILENPLYGKFRDKGLPFAQELTTLFKDVVATGEFAFAPSSGILPPKGYSSNDDEDVYRPCLKNLGLDVEEGSGDSEDASVGATTEFRNINLNTSQGAASQVSGQKRKRASGAEKKGKKKFTPSVAIAQAVCSILKWMVGMNTWNKIHNMMMMMM
ncbi:L10-interacting MYB domain-containing protein-like [Trifolium pratense]|nr:L10-interacting MYB domain-containing protein-like [Trifolium pratense]XP_045800428.1 L10-interacting MYB domain-containing protein-like [Trifolium pratense]XP_045800429.1 L10-interacting MYB domain-containing protein-like [Trifolium pratense]